MTEKIIPMSIDNLDKCIDLYINVFNAEPWNEKWSYENVKELLTDLCHNPRFKGFILVADHNVIGFVAGFSKACYQGTTFYLAEFCISHESQGKGYGSKLLAFLEDNLKQENVKSVYLLTSRGVMTENFYKKCSYKLKENRIVFHKFL